LTTIVLVLIIITIVTIFSIQNAAPVTISFLFWRFEVSLAIVIFFSALAGALVAAITYYLISIKRSLKKERALPETPRDLPKTE